MVDVTVENLTKKFGNFTALKGLNMTFPAGMVTCLLGPSGCGKTTLMRIIAGLETPTTGVVRFGDIVVNNLSTRQRNIGMVFQYPVVYRGLTVRQNIELPLLEDRSLSKAEREERIEEALDVLEMRHAADAEVSELDNGTRQKVACAREVARRPRIILFDEPITNVDINSKLQLKRALKEVFTRLRQTVIYVTHDQTEAMTLADQIALMNEGEITQMSSPRDLYDNPKDAFAGFFLGNPGMNFYEGLEVVAGAVTCPLFPAPFRITGRHAADRVVTLGIRPEHVRVSKTPSPGAVRAHVHRRAIVTGGQYLVTLRVGDLSVRAKVPASEGEAIAVGEEVWLELPPHRVRIFGSEEVTETT
ncbi:MAG: ABC transporter ATP-binding protein [Anaerolineae bacterium]|nr:ABC transporter ATP-binding protein [Thermoflexales bacterium]MDW8395173.1 ABC transporter ATP-binding protein [Anaerolineae bacterium]